MKLIRFGELNNEKPGVCIDGFNYDVSGFINDYNAAFFGNGGLLHLQALLFQMNETQRQILARYLFALLSR